MNDHTSQPGTPKSHAANASEEAARTEIPLTPENPVTIALNSLEERVVPLLRAHPWTAVSLAMLTVMAWAWPELFVFRKFLMLPEWATLLPAPGHAGVYLSTLALAFVAWGTREFLLAVISTFGVCLVASAIVVCVDALNQPWDVWLLFNSAFNYVFVLFARLIVPALALLALRWAVRTWVKLKA